MLTRLLALSLMLSFINVGFGATVANPYQITLPIASQSEQHRKLAVKQGLKEILSQISARSNIENTQKLQEALNKSMDFVEQFSYEDDFLIIQYSADMIQDLLEEAGNKTWGQRRPTVILWLVIDDENKKQLIGSEQESALQAQVLAIAEQLGLPLVLPLMDLEDMASVSVDDVWNQYNSTLRQASSRYGAQAILIARIRNVSPDTAQYHASWQLLAEHDSRDWQQVESSLQEVLQKGISDTAHFLIKQYGTQQGERSEQSYPIFIGVQNIQSDKDFARVEAYFNSLDKVSSVGITHVTPDLAVFQLTPKNDNNRYSIAQEIGLDHHLVTSINASQEDEVDLTYRWSASE